MTPADLYATLDATWPAAATRSIGPWTVRAGQGGGQRVSATTAHAPWTAADIPLAEAEMAALGQPALFMIRDGDGALDTELAARGYRLNDPVVAYAAPCAPIAAPDQMTTFPHWPPLGIATDLWAEAGTNAARIAVMHRTTTAKTVILGRQNDRAAGVAFVAIHRQIAMLHALEVAAHMRRQGSANNILRAAAHWAHDNGATTLSLVVTQANTNARALYASLGMEVVGQYHYRLK
ncbi:MAG: GNAT family N-acetyltransferase [Paracoccaceae bacterium]